MIHPQSRRRRVACLASRFGAVVCALMLTLGAATALDGPGNRAQAAIDGGPALVVGPPGTTSGVPLTSGGSATNFALQLPAGAACAGDSASGGYRVQSYVVPAAVDPNTLTFAAQGPEPIGTGADFRQPLFTLATTRFVNITTGVATTPGGGGPVASTPAFNFAYLGAAGPTLLPPGTYNVGLACTLGQGPIETFWNVQMTFAADPADAPAGLTWTVVAAPVATTTTTTEATTTTTVAPPTSTTPPPGPTTTPPPSATTTVAPPGATTTVAGATTTTPTPVVGSGAGGSTGGGSAGGGSTGGGSTGGSSSSGPSGGSISGTLPRTGSSPMALAVWGVLLVVLGRMAILLGRQPEVRQAKRS